MQKIFKLTALVLFFIVIILLVIGILSGYETEFSISITIDSPKNTTWKRVVDYGEYSKWLFPGARVIPEKTTALQRNSMLNVYPSAGRKNIATEYKILEFNFEKKIAFRNIGSTQLLLVNDNIITLEIQSLPDGSSDLTWRETYRVKTFISKIYNQFFHKYNRKAAAKEALRKLKRLIEKY
jgi:hypothetical protein